MIIEPNKEWIFKNKGPNAGCGLRGPVYYPPPRGSAEAWLEEARKEIASLAACEEDVLSYALFPEIAKEFFLLRESQSNKVGSPQ